MNLSIDPASDLNAGFTSEQNHGEKKRAPNFDSAAKYLFDLSFDGDAPQAMDAPPPITLQMDELESIKAAMYEDGRNAGRAEAMQQGADQAATQMAQLAAHVQQLATDGHARAGSETETIADAVKAIAQNLLPAYLATHGFAEMEAIVRECLVQLKGEPRLVIRVNDTELDHAIKRFDGLAQASAFPGKLIILADNALKAGDLRVEWADGGLDRATGNLWAEVERILSRATGQSTTTSSATTPSATAYNKTIETTSDLNGDTHG